MLLNFFNTQKQSALFKLPSVLKVKTIDLIGHSISCLQVKVHFYRKYNKLVPFITIISYHNGLLTCIYHNPIEFVQEIHS